MLTISEHTYRLFVLFDTLQTIEDKDFLTIYDGVNDDSNVIKKLSGNLRNFGMSSSGNVLYIKFESDGHNNDNGFLATFYYGNDNTNDMQITNFLLQ